MNNHLNTQAWLKEHGDYLYSYAFSKVKDKHAAEDLVQETLLAALVAQNSFANQSTIRTWLTGILKHKIVDHFRRQGRVVAIGALVDQDNEDNLEYFFKTNGSWIEKPDTFPSPESVFQQKEFWEIFQKCLSELKSRQAEIFIAKEMHDMSNEDICKHFSITPTNAWVIMHRARLSLIKCLEIHWKD
ncbi:sigma-70 family RNA polymerase sigma factor [Nitrosomonas sp.]|uniref:sigma-70 family RNA polymerase sigma factor n=1 Tax=Nitrosomonas sp. TaxID=42353 RepID=UPI00208C5AD5|nr:sigma-70 family RNA polymerase sigma factor [Nitrosomonas sp.]GJL74552.1 MAG: putative RNA polymerase sigma factor [Nitrosomonas sp.]